MLRAIATVGYVGCLPRGGGLLAAALGLAFAGILFLSTLSTQLLIAGGCLAFALAAWAMPRAMNSADVPDNEIVIDRFIGVWLAGAPLIPATFLAAEFGFGAVALMLTAPLLLYHLLLSGPLRPMNASRCLWVRFGDDLIAGLLATLIALAAMAPLLSLLLSEAYP